MKKDKKKIIYIIIFLIVISAFSISEIKADTTYSWTAKQSRIYYDNNGTEAVYDWHNIPYTHSANYPITKMQYRLQYSSGLDTGNTYTFTISYTPNPDAIQVIGLSFSDSTGAITGVNCSGWSRNSSGKYSNTCAVNPTRNITSSNYLYAVITYNPGYLTTLKSEVSNFSITKGVGAIIQDSAIDIMNNQNNNTTTITNNQNQNTQAIIDKQEELNDIANQVVRDSIKGALNENKICKWEVIDKNYILDDGKYYSSAIGKESDSNATGITRYIEFKEIKVISTYGYPMFMCYFDENKTMISCQSEQNISTENITIPTNAKYIRFSINKNTNTPVFNVKLCKMGTEAINDILNEEHTYNNNASEQLNGQNDIDNMTNKEQQIMNSLDFSGANNLNITIDSNTSSYIWQIVEQLRGINGKIVLLFTSILGLGIIKMILNR